MKTALFLLLFLAVAYAASAADLAFSVNERAFLIVRHACPRCAPEDIRTTILIWQENKRLYRDPRLLAGKVLQDIAHEYRR